MNNTCLSGSLTASTDLKYSYKYSFVRSHTTAVRNWKWEGEGGGEKKRGGVREWGEEWSAQKAQVSLTRVSSLLTSFPRSLSGRREPWRRDCSLFPTPHSTNTAFRSTNLFKQHFIDMYSFFLFCHLPGKKCEQGSYLAWLFGQKNEKHCKKVKALISSSCKD